MFSKRKYCRKSHNRKPFRQKTRRRAILRPVVPEPPVFDAVGSALYSWTRCVPDTPPTPRLNSGLQTLRRLAAAVVAKQSALISAELLSEAPWLCWGLVWQNLIECGQDSPYLFREFYLQFGCCGGFRSHHRKIAVSRTHSSVLSLKQAALSAAVAPTRHHRVENVFSNISLPEFASFVSTIAAAAVVVDCSGVRVFSSSQLVSLCSARNLEALDLSDSDIDDRFLYTLRASMVSKGSRLRVLRLCNCPNITEAGIHMLMAEPGPPSLLYLESGISVEKPSFSDRFSVSHQHDVVPGTRWRSVAHSDPLIGPVHKFHLANKLLCLLRHVIGAPPPDLVWDFKFFPQVVESSFVPESLARDSWNSRLAVATTTPTHVPTMYVKDCSEIAPQKREKPQEKEHRSEPSVFGRLDHVQKPKVSSVRKPRVVANASSFFLGR